MVKERNSQAFRTGSFPAGDLAEERHEEAKEGSSKQSCTGNRQYPGPNDATNDAPAHGGETMRVAYADNGAGDCVGGADRNTKNGVGDVGS